MIPEPILVGTAAAQSEGKQTGHRVDFYRKKVRRKSMNKIGVRMSKSLGAILLAVLTLSVLGTAVHAQDAEVDEPGALVVSVVASSPAAEAGLARGDVILVANDEVVDSAEALIEIVFNAEPGELLTLQVLHGDEERELAVELGERDGRAFLGIQPYMVLPSLEMPMAELHHPTEVITDVAPMIDTAPGGLPAGAVIVVVDDNSPAATAGLQPGDVIVGVDGEDLSATDGLGDRVSALSPGDEVVLSVRRGGSGGEVEPVTVTLGSHPDDETRAFLGVGYTSMAVTTLGDSAFDEELEQPEFPHHPGHRHHFRPFGGSRHFFVPPANGHGYFRTPRYRQFWPEPKNGDDLGMPRYRGWHHWESE